MRDERTPYLSLLLEGAPPWLFEYAAVPGMRRLAGIGLFCGTDYSRLYRHRCFYSRLDHSLGVAGIVWRFTHSRADTIAALLHDIRTPVFSHSVDFMNGDALTQRSTEAGTAEAILGSAALCRLLRRDGIEPAAVADYHLYPIADNDSPRLSADRLEYTLSTAMFWHGLWDVDAIRDLLEGLTVAEAEDGQPELAFRTEAQAAAFLGSSLAVCRAFQKNENKVSLSYLGDLLRAAVLRGVIAPASLYRWTEAEAIAALEGADDPAVREAWRAYTRLSSVGRADEPPREGYAVRVDAKRRYIDPLVTDAQGRARITERRPECRARLSSYLAYEDARYGTLPFAPPR